MSGVTDSHKTAASVQSEKSVESAEPAEIVAVTQGETERRMSDLSAPAGASSHGKGRLSARGNWHTRLRVGIMAARSTRFTTATWSPPPKSPGYTTSMR